jgi:hypothetical protein
MNIHVQTYGRTSPRKEALDYAALGAHSTARSQEGAHALQRHVHVGPDAGRGQVTSAVY